MHVYYTDFKSDSYSQVGVNADLVGVGSLKVSVAYVLWALLYYNPTILKFPHPPLGPTDKATGISNEKIY